MVKLGFLTVLCFLLSACSQTKKLPEKTAFSQLPEIETQLFEPRINVPTVEEITQLTPAQQEHFLKDFNDPRWNETPYHKRVFHYLDHRVVGFDYRGETYMASEAWHKNAGNCMSLAMLTYALTKVAGVEIRFQQVNVPPIYKKESDVMLLSYHVRSFIYEQRQFGIDDDYIRDKLVIDYFPDTGFVSGQEIGENAFISMFYRNLAAEKVVEQEYNQAFWLIREALAYTPTDAESINLLAVIYRRVGQVELAKRFFQFGMDYTEGSLNLLGNYQLLLEQEGDTEKASLLAQQLSQHSDNNPYGWIALGHEAFKRGNFYMSQRYFRRAIDLAPYLDDAYFGLAKALYSTRDYHLAAKTLKLAAEKAFNEEDRALYYAKLAVLQAGN